MILEEWAEWINSLPLKELFLSLNLDLFIKSMQIFTFLEGHSDNFDKVKRVYFFGTYMH